MGRLVTAHAEAQCSRTPVFEFLWSGPNSHGVGPKQARGWGGPAYTYDSARWPPGGYTLEVVVSESPSLEPLASALAGHQVTGPPPPAPASCGGAKLSAGAGAVTAGTLIPVVAAATCPAALGPPEFEYWHAPAPAPGNAPAWQLDQAWTRSSAYAFPTVGWQPGEYLLMATASGSSHTAASARSEVMVAVEGPRQEAAPLQKPMFPCTSLTATSNVTRAPRGDPVQLSAAASCPGNSAPVHYTYLYAPSPAPGYSPVWRSASGWTPASTFIFDTAGWTARPYLLLVQVTDGAPPLYQVEQEVAFTVTTAGTFSVSGIAAYHPQIYQEDCEEAALQMALEHSGRSVPQPTILGLEGVNRSVPGIGPKYKGDPFKTFVGPPNGYTTSRFEPGTYYPVIARTATSVGAAVVASRMGISPDQLFVDVEDNHPAVVWVTFTFQRFASTTICAQGDCFPWAGGHEHAVTVIGLGVNSVLIDNPWPNSSQGARYYGSSVWVPMSVFDAAYATYGDMAVVIG